MRGRFPTNGRPPVIHATKAHAGRTVRPRSDCRWSRLSLPPGLTKPVSDFLQIEAAIPLAMAPDRYRLKSRLQNLRQAARQGKLIEANLSRLSAQVQRSMERRRTRELALPSVEFDSTLPIHAKRGEIAQAIRDHQVVIVCGETGSGKSTQIPKICLEMGRGVDGVIGHTQPRRLAARSIAARLAEELRVPLGQQVGYKIRFTDRTRDETYVKLMTDGILLAETPHDRFLNQYDTIILDEAHERSLNIDFLIGYLKRLLPKRPELRCMITSATIDARRFSEFFPTRDRQAPVIEVSRTKLSGGSPISCGGRVGRTNRT